MLQSSEYKPAEYLKWFWRTKDFRRIAYRKSLVQTRPAQLLLFALLLGSLIETAAALYLLIQGLSAHSITSIIFGAIAFILTPLVCAHLVIVPLYIGNWLFIKPLYGRQIRKSAQVFKSHPGVRIAIAGSYGKTTMKEILLTVLSEGKKVAATPANRNVAISHAQFAQKLTGDEEILLIEYGEGAPGDVARFAKKTQPTAGVITGLAPAHLDRYKTLEAAGKDIFSLARFVDKKNLFVNGEAAAVKPFIKKGEVVFDSSGIAGWKVENVNLSISGLSFNLVSSKAELKINSRLLGRHQIAPMVLAAYLGDKYGLSKQQIETGLAKAEPFEHRMKQYQLSGAWIIDDTYNGNIEGMKAGLALLAELKAKRKIYVTPGLVDQGAAEERVHQELGLAIAEAGPDKVILMKHSVTEYILQGLEGYTGELIIEADPLNFYTNLDKFVAAGDLVLMQNDWPDNYN
jgi:UDP-N-acetylmuramoyl-tripeptide--D-alanyl-D-alanine ligase